MSDELNILAGATNKSRLEEAYSGTKNKSSKNSETKEACRQFEGMMAGIILKQGLKPGSISENEENNVLHDFAIEKAAKEIGANGALGIGDMMYQQMILGSNK